MKWSDFGDHLDPRFMSLDLDLDSGVFDQNFRNSTLGKDEEANN